MSALLQIAQLHYPVNEIAEYVQDVSQGDIDVLVEEYYNKYDMILDGRDPEEFKKHVAVQAGIEIGFERFLEESRLFMLTARPRSGI